MADVKLTIDIAGFYYQRDVDVKSDHTLEQAMQAAVDADNSDPKATKRLIFKPEMEGGESFMDLIQIEHLERPVSRQARRNVGDSRRTYKEGPYGYRDDRLDVLSDGGFAPKDPTSSYVLAWQYYRYDAARRDLGRLDAATDRKVVPFSKQLVGETTLLVWRLVAIFLKPFDAMSIEKPGSSMKIIRARQRSNMFN